MLFFQRVETCRLPSRRLHSCLSQWQPLKPKAFHSTSACPQPCSRMTSAPTSADACLSIVHSLMCHRSEVVLFYSKPRISPGFTLQEVAGLFSFGPSLAKSRGFPQRPQPRVFQTTRLAPGPNLTTQGECVCSVAHNAQLRGICVLSDVSLHN
jgi:hypothetical protein